MSSADVEILVVRDSRDVLPQLFDRVDSEHMRVHWCDDKIGSIRGGVGVVTSEIDGEQRAFLVVTLNDDVLDHLERGADDVVVLPPEPGGQTTRGTGA